MLGNCPFIATSSTCQTGEAAIAQMDSVFQSLPVDIQNNFQSAHDMIMASYNANHSFYTDWIPLNPDCVIICQIGEQADALTSQMQIAIGQVPASHVTPSQMSIQSMLILAAVGYLTFVYLAQHHG